MKVYLAGYNVDTAVLEELQKIAGKRQDLTPEVLSAAYARISRDPRAINEIRKDAREEVEKSRKSNSTIIFKMGHHSVAEHAVFNLDIVGASRLAMEEIEKFRLCSYTEKSQRYITLDKDYVIPEEIRATPLEKRFVEMVVEQNQAYKTLYDKLIKHVFDKHADLAQDQKKHTLLEGWAKEDARYVTSLATESQVGQTINARNLELLLRRFASSAMAEIRELGKLIHREIEEIAPSIVIFYQANDKDLKTYSQIKEVTSQYINAPHLPRAHDFEEVTLVEHAQDADERVVCALLHSSSDRSYEECRQIAKRLSQADKMKIFKSAWENLQFYDSMLREFEFTNLTFDIVLSAACFGQLKRHRMSTITTQHYDPALGVTIPESIKEVGMEKYFNEIIDKTNHIYEALHKAVPIAAPYILTNAHRRRVLMRVNARELYHISRLREDAHAQWDIQRISHLMAECAKKAMPLTFALIGGKDKYNQLYEAVFGKLPKIVAAALPQARKIKED